jgi:signal transduction histidine kinase
MQKNAWLGSQADLRFHAASREIFHKTTSLERICIASSVENQRKSRKLFQGILIAWSFILIAAIAGLWSIEMRRKRTDESLQEANRQLLTQAEELTRHRENLAETVVQQTADLTTANEQLRLLSSRLLTAQELERSRISRELHDELGQALNVTKLRIRAIEKGLGQNCPALHRECEQLLEYLDDVIEDVRRLSLDLSPTLLDELGLTPAIQRLVDNLAQVSSVNVTADIEAVDGYFERNQWITIYRVVQEALTNIGRHARADNVTITIRRRDGEIAFLIEDDGEGFDPEQAASKEPPGKGLGLTTMAERVCMMNGTFDLRSSEGRGTRISFSIPTGINGAVK